MQIIEMKNLDKGRKKLSFDNGKVIVLYKKECEMQALVEGAELTAEQYETLLTKIVLPRAKKRLIYLLEKKDYTRKQLWDKLKQGYYEEDIIAAAVEYMEKLHYIDDNRYAMNYVRHYSGQKSSRLLYQELLQKGITKELVESAISSEYPPDNEAHMIEKWIEKRKYDKFTADTKEKQRIYQFLMRKGFHSDDILKQI
jgi:regulatory protein